MIWQVRPSRSSRDLVALVVLVAACQPATVQSGKGSGAPSASAAGGAAGPADSPTGAAGAAGLSIPDAGPNPSQPPAPPATCAQETHVAEKVPVDLVLLVDASGSMEGPSGGESKWQRARAALGAFVKDPGSAGLGVGLSLFPSRAPAELHPCLRDLDCAGVSESLVRACHLDGVCFAAGLPLLSVRPCAPGLVSPFNCPAGMTCKPAGKCSQSGEVCVEGGSACAGGAADRCATVPGTCRTKDDGCSVAAFGHLDVDVGDLPGRADAVVATLAAREPDGSTPMALAADSALAALAERQKALPDRKSALVLATDGFPGCREEETVDAVEMRLARARAAAPSIPTYVVGVFGATEIADAQSALQRFATAGGTQAPFVLTAGDDLTQKLLAALKQIRGQAVACDYSIPTPQGAALDLDKVNVTTTSQGSSQDLARVAAADRCATGAGWYYDTPPASGMPPGHIVLCPSSCDRLKGDPAARVDLVFGCATRRID